MSRKVPSTNAVAASRQCSRSFRGVNSRIFNQNESSLILSLSPLIHPVLKRVNFFLETKTDFKGQRVYDVKQYKRMRSATHKT